MALPSQIHWQLLFSMDCSDFDGPATMIRAYQSWNSALMAFIMRDTDIFLTEHNDSFYWRLSCRPVGTAAAFDRRKTVLPSGRALQRRQEWFVKTLEDGAVAIQNPADIFPSNSLSYKGEAEEGKKVIPEHVADFPIRQLRVEIAPWQRPFPVPYFIRVPDKDLVVIVPPSTFSRPRSVDYPITSINA
ncbi:hypothetical protein K443DRAFT_10736 [Laccaria amethystina LaAM-08-1]|uniref:Uncharacterized protein n=1 Tax=Laccaria amethystina LaAM-08-1 TaxID=1095629 RepID=A0A0C9WKE6_9AGAR|nr:hypothetical protein K443DRAFT_10736 [Laccaria amethystina LaAM-08-1]